MADYYREIGEEFQVDEATAAKRTIYFEVGTVEAQTVNVSKAGAGFGATAGSVAAAVDGSLYKLTIDAGDIDTEGDLAFKCVGATDTQYLLNMRVVDHDPFDAIAEILADTGTDGVKIGADAIANASIADNAFGAEHFAANWLEAAGINADAFTNAKFADNVFDTEQFAADFFDGTLIADDAFGAEHFAADWLEAAGIASGAFTADAFAADALVAATFATGAFTADAFAADALVNATFEDGFLTAAKIGADAITAAKIGDNAFAPEHFAANALVSATFADNFLTAAKIATDAFGALELASGAADEIAGKILATPGQLLVTDASGYVTVGTLDTDVITAASINTGAFTADAFAADALVAATFDTDFLAADGLAASAVSEIAAAVSGGTPNPVYQFQVDRSDPIADNRTLYFYAEGTLPGKASISTNGGAFTNSTATPATVNGSWRKLVLTKAEVATEGRLLINITTSGTIYTVTLVVDVVKRDEFNPQRDAIRAARPG